VTAGQPFADVLAGVMARARAASAAVDAFMAAGPAAAGVRHVDDYLAERAYLALADSLGIEACR